jgi:hypothetical protein
LLHPSWRRAKIWNLRRRFKFSYFLFNQHVSIAFLSFPIFLSFSFFLFTGDISVCPSFFSFFSLRSVKAVPHICQRRNHNATQSHH